MYDIMSIERYKCSLFYENMQKTREETHSFLISKLHDDKLQKHCIAVAAVMEGLAYRLAPDSADIWWVTGLLHDIDYEDVGENMEQHSIVGARWIEEAGYPQEVVYAVRAHNDAHGLPRESALDKALFVADAISGLVIAAALVMPEKKLSVISAQTVLNRFKEKAFARAVNREDIRQCEELGLSLEEFAEIAIDSLQRHSNKLGL